MADTRVRRGAHQRRRCMQHVSHTAIRDVQPCSSILPSTGRCHGVWRMAVNTSLGSRSMPSDCRNCVYECLGHGSAGCVDSRRKLQCTQRVQWQRERSTPPRSCRRSQHTVLGSRGRSTITSHNVTRQHVFVGNHWRNHDMGNWHDGPANTTGSRVSSVCRVTCSRSCKHQIDVFALDQCVRVPVDMPIQHDCVFLHRVLCELCWWPWIAIYDAPNAPIRQRRPHESRGATIVDPGLRWRALASCVQARFVSHWPRRLTMFVCIRARKLWCRYHLHVHG